MWTGFAGYMRGRGGGDVGYPPINVRADHVEFAGRFIRLRSFEGLADIGLLVREPHLTIMEMGPVIGDGAASADSIYVSVRDTASGLVSVTCVDEDEIADSGGEGALIFSGDLTLQNRQIRFSDPNEMISMTIPVKNVGSHVEIYADDVDEPAALVVAVSAAKS